MEHQYFYKELEEWLLVFPMKPVMVEGNLILL
jgi:hypothetical protein